MYRLFENKHGNREEETRKKRTNLEEEVSEIKEKDQEPVVRPSWAERLPKIDKKKENLEASLVGRQNPTERPPG